MGDLEILFNMVLFTQRPSIKQPKPVFRARHHRRPAGRLDRSASVLEQRPSLGTQQLRQVDSESARVHTHVDNQGGARPPIRTRRRGQQDLHHAGSIYGPERGHAHHAPSRHGPVLVPAIGPRLRRARRERQPGAVYDGAGAALQERSRRVVVVAARVLALEELSPPLPPP